MIDTEEIKKEMEGNEEKIKELEIENEVLEEELNNRLAQLARGKTAENERCFICNSAEKLEWHHIIPSGEITAQKHYGNSSSLVDRLLEETIPLCKDCHMKVHKKYRNSNLYSIVGKAENQAMNLANEKIALTFTIGALEIIKSLKESL